MLATISGVFLFGMGDIWEGCLAQILRKRHEAVRGGYIDATAYGDGNEMRLTRRRLIYVSHYARLG